ncbi:adenylate/guanylate cyclase domain-containing protein [Draconibacterium halophilum]|uniref:Adenylate/guanylate cyclase domain-containing protein n=1 Tax=Draconibacterium halophilum TaxID=2706887 RepID=A0A6C0RAG0_9BACT|nr:adenylate/guanylate cyclase domain-containing protein [Draconibacterium halophilum]QIA06952.1 adenylate/guanylate cyclase domain-containing protein [Draconibacterium halophilum]
MPRLERTYKGAVRRHQLLLLGLTLLYWNLVIRFALFMRLLGARDDHMGDMLSKGMSFLVEEVVWSSVVISLFATLSWFTLNKLYPRLVRNFKMRKLAVGVVFLDILIFLIISILLGIVHYSVAQDLSFAESISHLPKFLFNSTILFFLIVLFVGGYVYQLINTLLQQVGYVPLGKIMMGYYQKPREEELIFMFLDLESSTAVAEKLGHEKYSYFIQDCFKCVSNSLLATRGRVYQFVGDEVVISWDAKREPSYKRAVDFFFLYEKALNKRRDYFEQEYGMMPVFTASLNVGKVMAAEVGEIKRELAFHGDVLNTAARIQKQCKRYSKKILVTNKFAVKLIKSTKEYKIEYVDLIKFFGKKRSIKIYEVHQA